MVKVLIFIIFINFRNMDAIHAFAREGEVENLLKCIESGVSVDVKGLLFQNSPFIYSKLQLEVIYLLRLRL